MQWTSEEDLNAAIGSQGFRESASELRWPMSPALIDTLHFALTSAGFLGAFQLHSMLDVASELLSEHERYLVIAVLDGQPVEILR